VTREKALEVSDALVERGITHTLVVGVHDGYMPRERYTVNVTPTLTYSPTDITALQRIADSLKCGIAYVAGSFTFSENDA
jgi:hypothetical protein